MDVHASNHHHHTTEESPSPPPSSSICCFFCVVKEPDCRLRRSILSRFFRAMPCRDDPEHVLVMSYLWSIAMSRPSDPYLPTLGALRCASRLIARGINDPSWLLRHQNLYIPYYAAHILGSYTIRRPSLASLAASAGAVPPLVALLRGDGKMTTWVEQRAAVRALGHLASFPSSFPAVARHGEEVVRLAARLATTCHSTVYKHFISLPPHRRPRYHRDLLTRGLGGDALEERKAEEWGSQMQQWSLQLLCCFAAKDRASHAWICRDVGELSRMWGCGSPAGPGLARLLCRRKAGRGALAGCPEAVESLCSLARSADEWHYIGIECLILLLNDPQTRHRVLPLAAACLADLAEHRTLGGAITECLLRDFKTSSCADEAVRGLWEERMMRKRRVSAADTAARRREGNERYWAGDMEGAAARYTEALVVCPAARRRERSVLYSNRAQCRLMLREAEAVISDATRAMSLGGGRVGRRSLWRRAQAYDMEGMAKESLLDCVAFVGGWCKGKRNSRGGGDGERCRLSGAKVPYYVLRMISKQMAVATGLFVDKTAGRDGHDDDNDNDDECASLGLPTIVVEEPRERRKRGRGKGGRELRVRMTQKY